MRIKRTGANCWYAVSKSRDVEKRNFTTKWREQGITKTIHTELNKGFWCRRCCCCCWFSNLFTDAVFRYLSFSSLNKHNLSMHHSKQYILAAAKGAEVGKVWKRVHKLSAAAARQKLFSPPLATQPVCQPAWSDLFSSVRAFQIKKGRSGILKQKVKIEFSWRTCFKKV